VEFDQQETALEEGWLLAERERRFGEGLDELARRLDRSSSWVSRRPALVDQLPRRRHDGRCETGALNREQLRC